MMLDDITETFERNFNRVDNLINIYSNLTSGKGRKPIASTDILRAAVVLLHSSLEDFLRNLLIWKLPMQESSKLKNIPILGSENLRNTKFDLGDLVKHKTKPVEKLINESVREYLNKQSYNNTNDISRALSSIDIKISNKMKNCLPLLDVMIKRRHHIVHQADKQNIDGKGHHKVKSISVKQLIHWKQNVDEFLSELIELL